MFRPYPPTRPPLQGLTVLRGRPLILWLARAGPSLCLAIIGAWSFIGLCLWLLALAASCFHPEIDYN